ncbi:MAG: septum formation protein Maf [Chitinophagales bacterium]|nr:septum formation protein Maf [Chitinophagales bacterium]
MKIILSSASPRRRSILKDAGFDFEILAIDVDESFPPNLNSKQVPAFIASKKMDAARQSVATKDNIIITADTVVLLGDEIIGKPINVEDAKHILRKLSGKMHKVITAVCICKNGIETCMESETNVYFDTMTDLEIENYITAFKPFDKAGAYAIQEWIGLNKILRIEGDYYNVVGFPMSKVYPFLIENQ